MAIQNDDAYPLTCRLTARERNFRTVSPRPKPSAPGQANPARGAEGLDELAAAVTWRLFLGRDYLGLLHRADTHHPYKTHKRTILRGEG